MVMWLHGKYIALLSLVSLGLLGLVTGQSPDSDPVCLEDNGRFRDEIQCDKYYLCEKGIATEVLCDDGLVFDDSQSNRERCKLPHDIDCKSRPELQPRDPEADPRCERANGIFNHVDESVCNRYTNCANGVYYDLPCPPTLIFDITKGTCVRREALSAEARRCSDKQESKSIDGFTCPANVDVFGPQNLRQDHPIYEHPYDCRFYIVCNNGESPRKFGCPDTKVFDPETQQCKLPDEVPSCECYYGCYTDSDCPDTCNIDCSCPSDDKSRK